MVQTMCLYSTPSSKSSGVDLLFLFRHPAPSPFRSSQLLSRGNLNLRHPAWPLPSSPPIWEMLLCLHFAKKPFFKSDGSQFLVECLIQDALKHCFSSSFSSSNSLAASKADQNGRGVFYQTRDVRESILRRCLTHSHLPFSPHQVVLLCLMLRIYNMIRKGANEILRFGGYSEHFHPSRSSTPTTVRTAICAYQTLRDCYIEHHHRSRLARLARLVHYWVSNGVCSHPDKTGKELILTLRWIDIRYRPRNKWETDVRCFVYLTWSTYCSALALSNQTIIGTTRKYVVWRSSYGSVYTVLQLSLLH